MQEEKKVVEELNKLRVARKSVAAAAAKASAAAAGAAAGEAARGTLVERLKASDARIDAVKADEEKTRAEITKLREEEDKATAAAAGGSPDSESGAAAVSKLIAERDACRAASNEAYEAIKALRAEFKAQNDLWWESEREARKVRAAERKVKQAAFEAERAARDEERRAARAELAGEPFEREVMACEQLTAYLATLTAPSPAAAAAAAALAASDSNTSFAPPPPPGFKPVEIKKGTRAPVADDDLLALAGSTKQRGKGARAKAAKAAAAASAVEDAASPSRVLTHSLEILSAFGSLGVALPLTAGDVAAALEKLEAKKGAFLAKRERVKANGGVDPEEETKKEAKKEKKNEKKGGEKKEDGDAAAAAASSPDEAKKDDDKESSPAAGSRAADDAGVSVSVSVGGNGSDVAVKLSVPSDSAAASAAAAASSN